MTATEKKICSAILRDATSVSHKEFEIEGIKVITFDVISDGERYIMTKHNGEWVYIYHYCF